MLLATSWQREVEAAIKSRLLWAESLCQDFPLEGPCDLTETEQALCPGRKVAVHRPLLTDQHSRHLSTSGLLMAVDQVGPVTLSR